MTKQQTVQSVAPADPISNPAESSWTTRINPLKRKTVPPIPSERAPSLEDEAGFFSTLYFSWVAPLLHVGYQRSLELNDIWTVPPSRRIDVLLPQFQRNLRQHIVQPGKLNPLLAAIYETFKREILIGGICQFVTASLQVLTPFILRYLIAFAQDAYAAHHGGGQAPSIGRGIGLVVGIVAMQTLQSLCTSQFLYRATLVGGLARSTLIACIFEKALKLSGRAKAGSRGDDIQGWDNGRINNLMSTDTSRIELAAASIHRVWTAPIQILLTLALLCYNLTYSALAGFAFICIVIPLLGRFIGILQGRRREINKVTDIRIRLMNEVFASIRFIKSYAWDKYFHSRIAGLRGQETHKVFQLLSIRNGILAVAVVTPGLASLLTFITYSLTGHELNAAPIFSSLALFNALNVPLEWLPIALGQAVDAHSSIQRIMDFLQAEEHSEDTEYDQNAGYAVQAKDACFIWEQNSSSEEQSGEGTARTDARAAVPHRDQRSSPDFKHHMPFSMTGLNIALEHRELIAVIGSIGSGKSSLLSALAGEMRKLDGYVMMGSPRSFCPQLPWIQNASIRDNITFGSAFDIEKYNITIEACALLPDFAGLPRGDLTEVGERGITLSGGQKARISLARTVYADSGVVLLDDPLSAVDSHVSRHIMDQAICGRPLRGKCRILATHQLYSLHRVDRIIWMKSGRIHKIATFQELFDTDVEFQAMLEASQSAGSKELSEGDSISAPAQIVSRTRETDNRLSTSTTLMQKEDQPTNRIDRKVYFAYIRASGSICNTLLICSSIALAQSVNIVSGLWLSWWISNHFSLQRTTYIAGYAAIAILQSLILFLYAALIALFCTRASQNFTNLAFRRILMAPMSFFDTTPIGRILNRFSKDVDTMDSALVDNLRFFLFMIFGLVAVYALTIAYYVWFAVTLAPLLVAFVLAAAYYRASARELKRHEAVQRSLVFSKFGEALPGTTTIRAFKQEHRFLADLLQALDSMDGVYFLTFANQRWLATRLDALGSLLVFVVGILVVTSRLSVRPAVAGLVLSYLLVVVQYVQLLVRQLAEVENGFNAVERLHYYCNDVPVEEKNDDGKIRTRQSWPERGEVRFEEVELRYREGLPLVLKKVSFHVLPGERVGIVGRTGAGKSSIIAALLRLVDCSSGSISIDGIDISKISVEQLRTKLAVIPQDPTLFQGSVRSNIDPFNQHTDLDLWQTLERVGLNTLHLDSVVENEGSNFSLGQRQLLALARALVKNSRILVCDEATSSVDLETDRKIQRVFLDFADEGKTLICVAHRLMTVVGYDRIIVMEDGIVIETGEPLELFDAGGRFRGMCDAAEVGRRDVIKSRKGAQKSNRNNSRDSQL